VVTTDASLISARSSGTPRSFHSFRNQRYVACGLRAVWQLERILKTDPRVVSTLHGSVNQIPRGSVQSVKQSWNFHPGTVQHLLKALDNIKRNPQVLLLRLKHYADAAIRGPARHQRLDSLRAADSCFDTNASR